MPELPDVEGFRRVFNQHAAQHRVEQVTVRDSGVIRGGSARAFTDALRGRTFRRADRHGKWLIAPLAGDDSAVLLHFGMTGGLEWSAVGAEPHRHDRVVFGFAAGELRYRDMRKLTGLRFAADAAAVRAVLGELGPDAGKISRDAFRTRLRSVRRQVKPALLDQRLVAGLGNLLVDELLWRAKIHPEASTTSLTDQDCARLHARMRTVLRQSLPEGRVPPRKSWLTGRRDEPAGACPRCHTPLRHQRVGGRGTVSCPRCQPRPPSR